MSKATDVLDRSSAAAVASAQKAGQADFVIIVLFSGAGLLVSLIAALLGLTVAWV